jgi:hypothetical protein
MPSPSPQSRRTSCRPAVPASSRSPSTRSNACSPAPSARPRRSGAQPLQMYRPSSRTRRAVRAGRNSAWTTATKPIAGSRRCRVSSSAEVARSCALFRSGVLAVAGRGMGCCRPGPRPRVVSERRLPHQSEPRPSACSYRCELCRLRRSGHDPDPIVWVFFIEHAHEKG